ncbi:hypothetical protein [Microbacterium sp. 5K110]|uniref:hypothetical protein n=1 Tax=unclassified Microbacterium TaxID=2609290 RepID=UPI0010FE15E1|nr:hypothetical protein [Microbacterium sp. 5K110]TLF29024.1 hypothetical protein FE256_13465 [Microbacterium sp. 5K110]
MWDKVLERWTWAFAEPIGTVVVAVAAVVGILLLSRRTRHLARAQGRSVAPVLRLAAAAVVVAWGVDLVVRAIASVGLEDAWWTFALPVAVAAGGLGVATLLRGRGVRRTGTPTMVGVRRAWWTFPSRGLLWTGTAITLVLIVVTLVCGGVSLPDERGRFVRVDFGDAGWATFYGWTFGIPVLVGLAALVAVTVILLSRIAAPAFLGPSTVARERRERRVAADSVLAVSAGAVALALGGALFLVGAVGSSSGGVGIPGVGEFSWTPGYSVFAPFLRWVGWALLLAGNVVLLSVAAGATAVVRPEAMPLRAGVST